MTKPSLHNTQKRYANLQVMHGIDMKIGDGEFIVVVGPSDCGKFTLLHMMMGLEPITGGEVWIGDRVVNELEPAERDIAMALQNYALYPYMSVFGNMAYDLKICGLPKSDIQACMERAAGIPELDKLLDHESCQPSGRQRQRMVMDRAIVREPVVFLPDKPLSNLDAKLRVQMRLELRNLHHRSYATSLCVTRDQVEVMALADRMMVLSGSRVKRTSAPLEAYSRPTSTFVTGFTGSSPMSLVPVSRNADGGTQIRANGTRESNAATTFGHLLVGLHLPGRALMGLYSEYIESRSADEAIVFIDVRVVEALGADVFACGTLTGHPVVVRLEPHASIKAGDRLPTTASTGHLCQFDPQTARRIEALA